MSDMNNYSISVTVTETVGKLSNSITANIQNMKEVHRIAEAIQATEKLIGYSPTLGGLMSRKSLRRIPVSKGSVTTSTMQDGFPFVFGFRECRFTR